MEELHRELLKKRQKYLTDNIITEEGLLDEMKEIGLFTTTMIQAILTEKDPERQTIKMLEMIPKRGPEAYRKFLECLTPNYPWIVTNLKEKEEELINGKGKPDVLPEIRRDIREYVRELARTTRINVAQSKSIEDFLCRHITIDTNLTSAHVPGTKLFGIHKKLISAIPISSLDESDQYDLNTILPENVTVDKIEKEITLLVHRVNDLQATIDGCYDKFGETKEKELPDLIFSFRKKYLEREIRIEEIKSQLINSTRQLKVAKDKSRRAQEVSNRTEEERDELKRALDGLKLKIQKLQEERQRIGMRMPFDPPANTHVSSPRGPRTKSSRERSVSVADSAAERRFVRSQTPATSKIYKNDT